MAWSDVNIARGQNIASLVDTISRRAQAQKELEEKKKARRWQMLGDAANMGLGLWSTISGRKFEKGQQTERLGAEKELRQAEIDAANKREQNRLRYELITGRLERGQEAGEKERERQFKKYVEYPARIKEAAAGRSQQNIYSGKADQFAILGDIWKSTVEDNIAQHPEWLERNEQTGETLGYNLPQQVYDAILKQAEMAGIPREFAETYIQARNIGEVIPEEGGGDVIQQPATQPTVQEIPRSSPGLSLSQQADVIKNRAKKLLSSTNDQYLKMALSDYIKNITEAQARLGTATFYPSRGGNAQQEEMKLNDLLSTLSELIDKYATQTQSPRERIQKLPLWGRGKK